MDVDGPRGLGDHGQAAEDGLVVPVLEPQPETARGDVGRGDGFRVVEEVFGRGRGRAAAVEGGDEAGAVEGEGEVEVLLCVCDGGHAQACAGGVLEVGAHVDYVC